MVTVKILFDAHRKIRRAFTVHLSSDFYGVSDLGTRKVIVYIEQTSANPAVAFPLPPRVVSLRDYDDVSAAESQIIMGYPVICVTVRGGIERLLNEEFVNCKLLELISYIVIQHFVPLPKYGHGVLNIRRL